MENADFSALVSLVLLGSSASFILGLAYAWCFIATTPIIVALYNFSIGRMTAHLSLVNGSEC
jgi:hypothetical protein